MATRASAIVYGIAFDVPMTLENRGGLPVHHYDDVLAFLKGAAPESLVEGPGEDDEVFSRLCDGIALPGTSYVVREYPTRDNARPLVLVVLSEGGEAPAKENVAACEAYVASHTGNPSNRKRVAASRARGLVALGQYSSRLEYPSLSDSSESENRSSSS
jgi:hypothetical protein